MNKEKYLNDRKELLASIESLIAENKIEDANSRMEDVKKLDTDFENACLAEANLKALNENTNVLNLAKKGVNEKDLTPGEKMVDEIEDKNTVYENAWVKTLMGFNLTDSEKARMDEVNSKPFNNSATTTTHGILIPETVEQGIWQEAAELYPLYASVFKTHVRGQLSVLKSSESSNGHWYDEETPVADGSEKFVNATLNGCELSRNIPISWKLREMSIEEFIPFIKKQLATKMGQAAAYGVFSGKGKASDETTEKDEPRGIKTALLAQENKPQVVEKNEGENIAYIDITSMIKKVKGVYKKGAKFYATSDFIWGTLANILDATGKPYFIPDTTAGGVGRLFGFVVEEDDSIDTLLFGNGYAGYHLNVNKEMTLDQEDHKKDRKTDYIAYAILDGNVRTEKAFSYLELKKA